MHEKKMYIQKITFFKSTLENWKKGIILSPDIHNMPFWPLFTLHSVSSYEVEIYALHNTGQKRVILVGVFKQWILSDGGWGLNPGHK